MNFSAAALCPALTIISTVMGITEGSMQNNFHDLLGTGNAFDDFAG
jgi:hypothetical protein